MSDFICVATKEKHFFGAFFFERTFLIGEKSMKLNRKKYKPLTNPTAKMKEQYKKHLFMEMLWQEEVERYPYLAELDIGPHFLILK